MATSKVFLCHATSDKPFVRRLATDLERYGIDVWLDERSISVGDSLRESIEEALEQVKFVVVVLSPASVNRPWVKDEISAAFDIEKQRHKKLILPILLKNSRLPRFLRTKKYADFRLSYATGFEQLLAALQDQTSGEQFALETVDCLITLDMKRVNGSLVHYEKRQTHKCLRSGVSQYIESLSSDGFVTNFRVNPGKISKVTYESGLTHVTTMLPFPLHRGKTLGRSFSCVYRDSFMGAEEYWDERQHYPTRKFTIQLLCLKTRPLKSWWAYEKRGPDRFDVTKLVKYDPSNGRPILSLVVKSPRLASIPCSPPLS